MPSAASSDAETGFRAVQAGNAFEESVAQILQAVKTGAVRRGDRLPPERELAIQLNISRVTLREAIRALAEAGYLESRRGRNGGTFVVYQPGRTRGGMLDRVSPGRLEDVMSFRSVVEVGAAGLAADRDLGPAERSELSAALADVAGAPFEDYRLADGRLHLTLAELSGSALLTRAVAEARLRVDDFLGALPTRDEPLTHSNIQHDQIVAAVLANDVTAARRAMTRHLEATASLLRGFLT